MTDQTTETAPATPSRALVPHPTTGELIDLAATDDGTLAAAMSAIDTEQDRLNALERVIEDELRQRLDRSAKWTRDVVDAPTGVVYALKAPSPVADTVDFEPGALEDALTDLIEANVINREAAAFALRRRVTIVVEVPLGYPLSEVARDVMRVDEIADVPVSAVSAKHDRTPVLTGIAAVRKVPGAAERLDKTQVTRSAGRRRVTVTQKRSQA